MKQAMIDVIAGRDHLTEHPKNVVQGEVGGFHVTVKPDSPSNGSWTVVVDAKEGSNPPMVPISQFFTELRANHRKLTTSDFDGKKITIVLRSSMGMPAQIRAILDQTANYLMQNGYVTCCGCCGKEVPVALTSINGFMDFICDECYNNVCNDLEKNRQEIKAKKGNVVTGLVGALFGALLGGVVWVLVYQLGYIAGIAGLIGSVCALKGYEKFGGKINAVGIIISILMTIAALYFAQNISYAIEIKKALEGYDITFFEAYQALPGLMQEYGEIARAYWGELAGGIILAAASSAVTVYGMYKNKSGAYKTGRY